MKKFTCRLMGLCFLAVSLAALAQSGDAMKQDTMQQGDQMKHDNMNSDTMAKKSVSVSGKVSDDGKMFMSDKDNKNWMVSNPEAVKGHEGHHVTVRAHLDATKNEIRVTSVKMGKDEMKDTMSQDTMKKNEMQH
jgi:pentapeptide MXKDX repeat protein